MSKLIIGLNGYVNSGKDTVAEEAANMLRCIYGLDARVAPIAAPIRSICLALGFSDHREDKERVEYACYDNLPARVFEAVAEAVPGEDACHLYSYLLEMLEKAPCDAGCIEESYRTLAQLVGECGRRVHRDFWVDLCLSSNSDADVLIISDVRYLDELEVCDVLVNVRRDGCGAVNGHSSEAGYAWLASRSEYRINNDGDLNDLSNEVARVFDSIVEEYI